MRAVFLAAAIGCASVASAEEAPAPVTTILVFHKGSDSGETGKQIADKFVRPMLKLGADSPVEFAWSRYDIDGDGHDELFLALTGDGKCSVEGCPMIAMRMKPDKAWEPVLMGVAYAVEARRPAPGQPAHVSLVGDSGRTEWDWNAGAREMRRSGSETGK